MHDPGFKAYPKTKRINQVVCRITEKLDGTNALIFIDKAQGIVQGGSRSKWVFPGKTTDNYGFAQFIDDNREFFLQFPDGYHYGEWVGIGINRGYNLKEKTLFLFSFGIETYMIENGLEHPQVKTVPLLATTSIDNLMHQLSILYVAHSKSVVDPLTNTEGFVIDIDGKQRIKMILDK